MLNEIVRERLGGLASADLLIRSFNFADVEALQTSGRWDDAARMLIDAAQHLVAGGAEAVVICTNTMHLLADAIQAAITVPIIHIADAAGEAVRARDVAVVGVLGTRYTMEQNFYVGRLRDVHGLQVLIPEESDRILVHEIIYEELVRGVINPASKRAYRDVIERLIDAGATGIIAACTEIELLIHDDDLPVPLFASTRIHVEAAAAFALQGN